MVPDDDNIRQFPDRQREGLSTAENRITGQQNYRSGELHIALRFDVPGFQGCKVVFARTDLDASVKSDTLAVAEPVDDRDRSAVISARTISNIDDSTR